MRVRFIRTHGIEEYYEITKDRRVEVALVRAFDSRVGAGPSRAKGASSANGERKKV